MAEVVTAADHVMPKFRPILGDVFAHGHSEYWLSGGRGSTKSSFIAICVVLLVVAFPWANAVVVRRVSNTLRDSVYNQVLWAVDVLGLARWFRAMRSPLELVYLPTGQRIVFRGLDDPLKLKGITLERGYWAVHWFEELDQMDSWDDVSSALRSFRRGGDRFWTFYSYNPPKTAWSWANRKRLEMEAKPTCLCDHSTYLDVVEGGCGHWLGEAFLADAEWDRERDPEHWRWEYMGEATGTGGSVFGNVVRREVTDAEIATFDRPRNGVDWGWFPDPFRFVRCEWQPSERRLVVYGELDANRKLPSETGAMVVGALTYADAPDGKPYFHRDQTVWCDDTPDGKVQMGVWRKEHGIRARAARKGNMRRLSYQWLAGLREIVIDPRRAPRAAEEFALKEYARDRDGSWVDEIPDGNDHSIDAVRYAVMEDVRRGRAM